jgi:molybdopterin converting factor small subunit
LTDIKQLLREGGIMENEVMRYEGGALTAVQVRAQVNLIQDVMKSVMQNGQHYGVIPGAGTKPTLLKPGAEKLMLTFHLSPDPIVEDLSTGDAMRYRVTCRICDREGRFLGSGLGEASSDEEKYKWRATVCPEEYEATPEDRKRLKWKKGYGDKPAYKIDQIRTEPADIANTILKMAKKRALVDAALTVTAASDIFTQDIEDMPPELLGGKHEEKPPLKEPQKKEAATKPMKEPQKKEAATKPTQTVTALIQNLAAKEGEKNGKKYKRFIITDTNAVDYVTFDTTIAENAKNAHASGVSVNIGFVTGKFGNDIKELTLNVPEEDAAI